MKFNHFVARRGELIQNLQRTEQLKSVSQSPMGEEIGESSSSSSSSSSNSASQIWAKLEPFDAKHSDIELCSNEMVVSSQITSSSQEKHEWCKIKRNPDLLTAMMQNKSSNNMLVDDAVVQREEVVELKCGTEIVLGPNREGYLSYRFKLMPGQETCKQQLKISVDVEHAKCSICLNIWHDVVTVAPCLHNFCNGCFSEWLKRSRKKHSNVLCPECRAVVHFAGRNHFLRNIEEDILRVDPSLRRSNEEVALIESYATITSNLPAAESDYMAQILAQLQQLNANQVHFQEEQIRFQEEQAQMCRVLSDVQATMANLSSRFDAFFSEFREFTTRFDAKFPRPY